MPPPLYPADPAVETIVADAVDGGQRARRRCSSATSTRPVRPGPLVRAGRRRRRTRDPDIVENRGGESTLGNLVAEVQRWATEPEEFGGAEIAFMNPGGLRANMARHPTVTYRQAADVQPFANTLVNMDLTGAQIKTVLEQQWQRDGDGQHPDAGRSCASARPRASSTPTTRPCPRVDRITGIWLNDEPIVAGDVVLGDRQLVPRRRR